MFATTKDIYKRNDSILLWIVVDMFVVRWATKTWKCVDCDLPWEQLFYLKNQNKTSTELLP